MPAPNPVILYDGVCGLCNRLVRFVLKRDRSGIFRFASLQSGFAAPMLRRHGASPEALDTMYVVLDYSQPSERLLARSDAALYSIQRLSFAWRTAAAVFRIFPRTFREWCYRLVASHRYRIFGRYEACPMPDEKYRRRFLDQAQ